MKRKNKKEGKLFIGILIAVLVLGIGYAAVSGINLIINGSATAIASGQDSDFIVHFDDLTNQGNYITYTEEVGSDSFTQTFVDSKSVTAASSASSKNASITIANDQLSANVAVSNLTAVGDTVTFTIPVINESDGLSANLSATVLNENEEYFDVDAEPAVETLNGNGATTTITVTVSVIKVPNINDETGSFTVTLNADPVE